MDSEIPNSVSKLETDEQRWRQPKLSTQRTPSSPREGKNGKQNMPQPRVWQMTNHWQPPNKGCGRMSSRSICREEYVNPKYRHLHRSPNQLGREKRLGRLQQHGERAAKTKWQNVAMKS